MLSRAQNIFHHVLNISYTRACMGLFLVLYNGLCKIRSNFKHVLNSNSTVVPLGHSLFSF